MLPSWLPVLQTSKTHTVILTTFPAQHIVMSPRHLLYAIRQSVVTVAFRVAALTFALLNNLQDGHLECFIWIQ